jgi:hypothetical protein
VCVVLGTRGKRGDQKTILKQDVMGLLSWLESSFPACWQTHARHVCKSCVLHHTVLWLCIRTVCTRAALISSAVRDRGERMQSRAVGQTRALECRPMGCKSGEGNPDSDLQGPRQLWRLSTCFHGQPSLFSSRSPGLLIPFSHDTLAGNRLLNKFR